MLFMLLYPFYLSHNPKVRGSNPLPATNITKGLQVILQPFLLRYFLHGTDRTLQWDGNSCTLITQDKRIFKV
jgi:hypothetical protein